MEEEFPIVWVAQGALRGKKVTTKAGNSYLSFEGVPYARPPVGPLRFKIAQPAVAWDGIKDALKVGHACPQIDGFLKFPFRGDEDCLYLNVYSPKLSLATQRKYPVMVWIHGGGFLVGSGDMVGPEYLVSEDVVVVTINYRLGVFGFMSVEEDLHPDNLGLRDQVAALHWIKENITVFGGDPSNVIIFGESAGAACVHYHLLSPMSKGLFHKAILQSGCALNPWAIDRKPRDLAFALARALDCNVTSTEEVLTILRTASARQLVETFTELGKQRNHQTGLRFAPTSERYRRAGEEIFLPDDPSDLMKRGQFHSVPCMIGMNSQEGILFLGLTNIVKNPSGLRDFAEHLETLIPQDVIPKSDMNNILEKVKAFYFGNEMITETSTADYVNFMSDTMFTRGIDCTAKYLASNDEPVYFYHFDFDGKLNIFKKIINVPHMPGASHVDEFGYLFGTTFFNIPNDVEDDSREGLTRKRMVRLWANFAKTGNPTPTTDYIISTRWPRFSSEKCEYLNINDVVTVQKDLYKENIEFWNNI